MTLFMVLSFFTYLRGRSIAGRALPVLSLVFFILALGAKEMAIQIPGLIFFHCLIFSDGLGRRPSARVKGALQVVLPYLLVCLFYLAWRLHVLGGPGDDGADLGPLRITARYFSGLLYPQDFLSLRQILDWSPGLVALGAVALILAFAAVIFRETRRDSAGMKLPILLLVWLVLPLIILIVARSFAYRSLYSTVVPFSLLSSLILSRGIEIIRQMTLEKPRAWLQVVAREPVRLGLFLVTFLLAVSLVAYSPLVRSYPQWRQSGLIANKILTTLADSLAQIPRNSVVNIDGLPSGSFASGFSSFPRAHSVSYLRDYSIQSWLDLQGIDRGLKVVTGHRQDLPPAQYDLDLQISRVAPELIDVRIVWVQRQRDIPD